MLFKFKLVMLFAALVLFPAGPSIAADYLSSPTVVDVSFTTHIDFPVPMPVQDVYIVLNDSTPDIVYRADPVQSKDPMILAKEAFATTNHTPHDPLMETSNPVGPFPRGDDLGFTLAQWLHATGEGTYTVKNANATMNFTFHNLVPNGTYTVWWAGVAHLPEYKFVVAPAGAPDGSENAFHADALGNGAFYVDLPALPAGTNETRTLIVVRYHSNGRLPGPKPGEYGKTAHVQLLYRMPLPEAEKQIAAHAADIATITTAINTTNTTTNNRAAKRQPGMGGFIAIMGLLAAAYYFARGR